MRAEPRRRLTEFFFAPASPKPLAVLRISLGIMALLEAAAVYPALEDLYGPHVFLATDLMRSFGIAGPPGLAPLLAAHGFAYSTALYALHWLRCAALVAFTLGAFTRTATIFSWLLESFFLASGALSSYGIDRYYQTLLFVMIFTPTGAVWSVDARDARAHREDSISARFGLRLLQLTLLLTYLNAGLAKASGPGWWNGDVIWRVLHLPEFHRADFLWMAAYPWVPRALGIATVILETGYIVAAWIPGLGLLWSLAIILMHLGIAAFMGLVNFGILLALVNAALIAYPALAPIRRRSAAIPASTASSSHRLKPSGPAPAVR